MIRSTLYKYEFSFKLLFLEHKVKYEINLYILLMLRTFTSIITSSKCKYFISNRVLPQNLMGVKVMYSQLVNIQHIIEHIFVKKITVFQYIKPLKYDSFFFKLYLKSYLTYFHPSTHYFVDGFYFLFFIF